MDSVSTNTFGLAALVLIALRLGWIVHNRSKSRKPIHGGTMSAAFNFLSGTCFSAILPTVLMTVLVLRPDNVSFAGLIWHPLLLAVLALGLGSYGFALLHAAVELGPLSRAQQDETEREALGWTEQDARASGL